MITIKDPKKPNVTRAYPAYSESGYRLPGQYQIPIDPETGQQVPILLPEATVYDDNAPLAGLQDVVTGSTFGQLARQYNTPQSMYDQARMVSQIGQEMTGWPGAMRTINRALGEGTVGGNPLFAPPADASTFDKVLDAADIIGAALPLVGPASKYGMKAVKSGVKAGVNAALSPEALKAADRLLKPDPSKGFSGGLISRPNMGNNFSSLFFDKILDAKQDELRVIRAKYDELIDKATGLDEEVRLFDEQQMKLDEVAKKYEEKSERLSNMMGKRRKGIDLDADEKDMLYEYLSEELIKKVPNTRTLKDVLNDKYLANITMSGANRGVQAMANKPVVRDALKLLARNYMNKSGGAPSAYMDEIFKDLKKPSNLLGKNREISYTGLQLRGDLIPDKGPNPVDAYIYGDFSNFKTNVSKEADAFARSTFRDLFDRYGDMKVVDLPMAITTSIDKPLKFDSQTYRGLIQLYEDGVNTLGSIEKTLSGMYSDSEKAAKAARFGMVSERDKSSVINNIFNDVTSQVKTKNRDLLIDSKVYDVKVNSEGIPESFRMLGEEGNNLFNPIINISGHQQKFDLISDDGTNLLYKVTSADTWKFTPEQYAKRWGTPEEAMKMKQAAMLDATGKPFVSVSEDYVQIPKKFVINKRYTPGTY